MKNERVIENYFNGKNCHSLNVYASGDNLINYNTIMVHFENNTYYVNISYYSVTTSKIQSYITRELYYIRNSNIIYYYGNKYGDNYKDVTKQVKCKASYNLTDDEKIGIDNIYSINCNKYCIQFYRYYKNILTSNVIQRDLIYDKNLKDSYFRYNKQRIYLNDLQLIGIEKIIQLRNDIKKDEF